MGPGSRGILSRRLSRVLRDRAAEVAPQNGRGAQQATEHGTDDTESADICAGEVESLDGCLRAQPSLAEVLRSRRLSVDLPSWVAGSVAGRKRRRKLVMGDLAGDLRYLSFQDFKQPL